MSKIRGLSLFANVGVSEALLSKIGVEILLANEIDKKRAKFYSELYPETEMICGDITEESIQEQLVTKSIDKKINFIIATPPCQGMSEAGKRNIFDERNQLITYAIDMIKKINPDFIFIENVPTSLKTKIIVDNETILIPDYIKHELEEKYNFNEETLVRAMNHGVPQMRQRNIFLITKKEININWDFPLKQKVITLQDAIGTLPSIDPFLREGIELTLEKFPNFTRKKDKALKLSKWHRPPVHSWRQVLWMMNTPSATSAIYNEKFYPKKENGVKIKAHHNNYRRMDWNKPSRTITQNNGVISSLCCVHPGRKIEINDGTSLYSDARVLTIYELLIVSTLPLDWDIPDWANETLIRKVIGEGIPSLLVKNIMLSLIKKLKE